MCTHTEESTQALSDRLTSPWILTLSSHEVFAQSQPHSHTHTVLYRTQASTIKSGVCTTSRAHDSVCWESRLCHLCEHRHSPVFLCLRLQHFQKALCATQGSKSPPCRKRRNRSKLNEQSGQSITIRRTPAEVFLFCFFFFFLFRFNLFGFQVSYVGLVCHSGRWLYIIFNPSVALCL